MSYFVGERIKLFRKELGLSQKELSEKLGLSRGTITQYETGKRIPTPEIGLKLAEFFGISMENLYYLSNFKKNPSGKGFVVEVPRDFEYEKQMKELDEKTELVERITGDIGNRLLRLEDQDFKESVELIYGVMEFNEEGRTKIGSFIQDLYEIKKYRR